MKNVLVSFILLLMMGCSSMSTPKPSTKTILEKYMDFNTSYYTRLEYKKENYKYLHSPKEEILGLLTLEDLNLLSKNKQIKKNRYHRYKKILLEKAYTDIKDAIHDKNYIKYMTNKDKTAKLSSVVHNKNKAIIQYAGGDETCIWSTQYLVIVKRKQLFIYEFGGFSAMYAPVKPWNGAGK